MEIKVILKFRTAFILLSYLLFSFTSSGALSLPKIFSDGMIFQRRSPIKIWGTSDPLKKVSVNFNHEIASVLADDKGNWFLTFPPMEAGGPIEMIITNKQNDSLRIKNI